MKKVLIIGDSLTEGIFGYDYVHLIKSKLPNYHIYKDGRKFDALINITERLQKHLRKHPKPDLIIIQAGINDILFSTLYDRGLFWKLLLKMLTLRKIKTSDSESAFFYAYTKMINLINNNNINNVILLTNSCIGENLLSKENILNKKFNATIRKLGRYNKLKIADIEKVFESRLVDKNSSSYIINSWINIIIDFISSRNKYLIQKISSSRNLNLTIDGVHLNEIGARIYAQEIIRVIDQSSNANEWYLRYNKYVS